jgi:two-component system CheB/CheR fusion protein
MLQNLISNAIKYTRTGRVLVGCRRHKTGERSRVSIEVWDTGIGIPAAELEAVFNEFHQVGNEARERSRGLGLGLSIVQRLGKLLGHPVRVRSSLGRGSVFTVDIPRVLDKNPSGILQQPGRAQQTNVPLVKARKTTRTRGDSRPGSKVGSGAEAVAPGSSPGDVTILVVEDDPDLLNLLQALLQGEGWRVKAAPDGPAAIAVMRGDALGNVPPSLLLCDYNLPGGITGLQTVAALRAEMRDTSNSPLQAATVPAIILTGDISATTLKAIAKQGCLHLSKPVTPNGLIVAIQGLLAGEPARANGTLDHPAADAPTIFVVDDDAGIRMAMRGVLEQGGYLVEDYPDGETFLAGYGTGLPERDACLLVDATMPGMDGLEVLRRVFEAGHELPAIVITGHGDVPMAVQAMKAGALDFIEKPVRLPELLASVGNALHQLRNAGARSALQSAAAGSIARLTPRQRGIMGMVLAGQPSKNIAADLGISQRTVENHRASIMRKTGTRSMPALARLALAAEG